MSVEDVVIREPLVFTDNEARGSSNLWQHLADGGDATVTVSSTEAQNTESDAWRLHAGSARLTRAELQTPVPPDAPAIEARCLTPVTAETHYETLADRGLDFGPKFTWRHQHSSVVMARRSGRLHCRLS